MKTKKEKLTLEFVFNRGSQSVFWKSISTPNGLQEWFADSVTLEGKRWIFRWEDSAQVALCISSAQNKYVRYRWEDEDDDTYFEFRINTDPVTATISLLITDFAEVDEVESVKSLWEKQVDDLLRHIGL